MDTSALTIRSWGIALVLLGIALVARGEGPIPTLFPEQTEIEARTPEEVDGEQLAITPVPRTVVLRDPDQPLLLSLDEAVRIALANADVIRILSGNTAVSSGRTIYDPAISNTGIDVQNARFDPVLGVSNRWSRFENGSAFFDPMNPDQALILGNSTGNYDLRTSLEKLNGLGGNSTLSFSTSPTYFRNQRAALNHQSTPTAEISYNQPLLQGGGFEANLAPIVIARIGTERSFYQFKDVVQEQVRSVVDGYWALVVARVDVWVRQRQVEQSEEALRVGEARLRGNINDIAQVAQARSALANFRAALVTAEANVIQREAALRNVLGLPPSDGTELIPVTEPRRDRYLSDWNALCDLAAQYRPDLIDLELAIQSDSQQLLQARNNALPRVDAVGVYRWKGISGVQGDGSPIDTSMNRFTDWTVGVQLSVPLGLRQGRALQRQSELALARDRANLKQGQHAAVHQLATTTRLIDQSYQQYLAFTEARQAARVNLQYQMALFQNGRTIYLNVLQAITDWGNTISSQANSLTLYNTQLATLERQTGTILETHGVYFYEEQFGARPPFGGFWHDRCYPLALKPAYPGGRYDASERSADESFELEKPQSPLGRDPLPELPYDQLPAIDSGSPVIPRELDSPSSQDLPQPADDLPPLPIPGQSKLPAVRGKNDTTTPSRPAFDRRLDENPFAAATKTQRDQDNRRILQGNNRLQNPDRLRDPNVRQASAERPVVTPAQKPTQSKAVQPKSKSSMHTPKKSADPTVAPAKKADEPKQKAKSSGWKSLFGG